MLDLLKTLSSAATVAFAPLVVFPSRAPHAVSRSRRVPLQVRQTPVTHTPRPEPVPVAAQWQQLAQGIEFGLGRARHVAELQSAALIQIDAADFTLAKIIEELAAVMPRATQSGARARRPVALPRQALAA